MHNRFIIVAICFLFFFLCNSSMALRGEVLTRGWKPIQNVNDPIIVDIGKFAVDQHNKEEHVSLKFEKVVKGETQVVAGTKYSLTIMAADNNVEHNYVVVVWDKPWQKFRQLSSFKGPI